MRRKPPVGAHKGARLAHTRLAAGGRSVEERSTCRLQKVINTNDSGDTKVLRNQPCTGVLCFQDSLHSTDEEAETSERVFGTTLRKGWGHQAAWQPLEGDTACSPLC